MLNWAQWAVRVSFPHPNRIETSSRTTPSSPRPLCSFSQSRQLGVSFPAAPPTTTSTSTSGPPRSFSISSASAHSETASYSVLICLPRRCCQLPIPIEARPIPIEVHPPNPATGGEEQPVRSILVPSIEDGVRDGSSPSVRWDQPEEQDPGAGMVWGRRDGGRPQTPSLLETALPSFKLAIMALLCWKLLLSP